MGNVGVRELTPTYALILLILLMSVCGQGLASEAEWQKKVDANYSALQRLQQENVELAQKIIEDPQKDFIRVISGKLKDHKGPGAALTPEEQQKLSELRQKSIEEAARAKAILSQITELTLDQFAIILSISEKCDVSGQFGNTAGIIKKHPIVKEHAPSFWQLKWSYDKDLLNMGIDRASCKTIASRWSKISAPLSNQLKQMRHKNKE